MTPKNDKAVEDKSDLQTALERVAVTPPAGEAEIAADDVGATALAETSQDSEEKRRPS